MTAAFRKKVDLTFHAVLKPKGFKKKGMLWKREREDFVDLIDVQSSPWENTFTLNLGVAVPDISGRLFPSNKELRYAADGVVEVRLGILAHDSYDVWWNKLDEGDINAAVIALERYGLPFIDSFKTRESMIEWLERKGYNGKHAGFPHAQYLALLYIDTGRNVDGCNLLRGILTRLKSDSSWKLPIKALLEKYCE